MKALGGFDKRFQHGEGGGDIEFVIRIKRLGLEINQIDTPYVYHQWHVPTVYSGKDPNRPIYRQVLQENKVYVENSYQK